MIRTLKKNAVELAAIVVLIVLAVATSGYILNHERLRFPFIQDKPLKYYAEFTTAQAVTAGQGQTIRVSGVKIGDIGDVELKDGHAVVRMDIDRKWKSLIHDDATALLRPKTGLKDMFVELNPGGRSGSHVVKPGFTIPIQNTLPDVNADEFLSALDSDTRDYLRLLIQGVSSGLKGRDADLRSVLRRFEPTHRDLARVTTALAARRTNLKHLIRSLRLLNEQLASRSTDLSQLVDSSATTLGAFAAEQTNLSKTVQDLPGALRQTTDTLGKVNRFANVLGPVADRLRPAVREIDTANQALIPLAKTTTPLLRNDIRPFVRSARPVVRQLRPSARQLAAATPDLTRSFKVLNDLFNMLGYNPAGTDGPSTQRQPGYLFYIAWLDHMAIQLFSISDAHGTYRPVTIAAPCSTLEELASGEPGLEALLNLTPILDSTICKNSAGTP